MQDVPQLHGTKKRKTICLLFTHHCACSDALKLFGGIYGDISLQMRISLHASSIVYRNTTVQYC